MKFSSLFIVLLFIGFAVNAMHFDDQGLDTLLKASEEVDKQKVEEVKKPSLEGSIRKSQDFTIQLNRMNYTLGRSLDSLEIIEDFPSAERLTTVVQNRLENSDSKISIRYLQELDNLLRNIRTQIITAERKVSSRIEELVSVKQELEAMKEDDLFRLDLRDASILPEYQSALTQLREQVQKTEQILSEQRIYTASFQTRISRMIIRISELSESIAVELRSAEKALLTKDFNYLWQKRSYQNASGLGTVFLESIKLNEAIFFRYLKNNIGLCVFFIFLFLGLYLWIRNILIAIKSQKEFSKIILERAHYVPNNPFLSVLVILTPIMPFFFPNPTISFLTVLLWVGVLSVTILLIGRFPKGLYRNWVIFVLVFLVYTVSNLYRDINYSERWYLILLSVIGVYLALRIVKFQKSNLDSFPSFISVLVKFYIVMQSLSIIANVFGRFTLSKMLGVAATISFTQSVVLYLFVLIILEVIYLQIELRGKGENDFTSYIDFHRIQKRLKKVLFGLAGIIWVYFFFDNLSLLDTVIENSKQFLSEPRKLVNSSFTFGNILVFFVIVYLSSLLANNVAYFATMKDQQKGSSRDKRLGSSILLIRLSVLSVGFLFAVAASGIGLDKIAIVLGALSLGIGFGLQTIVNNLVSGVILAFEKPIQIGDAIEVGGRAGTVKEVGIRSSKIQAYDGSEIIIPNGDLLSQHLINWTLSDKKRRVELIIGVSYNSDMDLVSQILSEQIEIEEIMKNPEPRVLLQSFADSAVEFRVLFWVDNFDLWINIRNQVMRGIFRAFKENGVEIPFPQRDLNFKSFPGLLDEKIKSGAEIEELGNLREKEDMDGEKG